MSKPASSWKGSADRCSVDVKALKTYQQIFIYVTPIITNLGFVNIIVVVVRLRWFSKRFKDLGMFEYLLAAKPFLELTPFAATKKPNAHRENQKQAVSQYADTRDMEGGLTGETMMPR